MITEIYATECLQNSDETWTQGFRVGREFVPMADHSGNVELLRSSSLRPVFRREGNTKNAAGKKIGTYRSIRYQLVIIPPGQPTPSNCLEKLAQSEGFRLCVLDVKGVS